MAIQNRLVEYTDGDVTLEAHMAFDDEAEGPRPGVMVVHAWAGRSPFEENVANKLAAMGYVGFAMDVYGKGVLGSGPEENAALMQPFLDDRPGLQRRLGLAMDVLAAQDGVDGSRLAATGYCFGGLCVLDLARTGRDFRGAVSFHGLFNPPGNTGGNAINAKVLALHGWDDPMVPPESVVELASEMTAAGADWQLHGYGSTLHAFTNPDANAPEMGAVYSADADRRSWQSMSDFLAEVLL